MWISQWFLLPVVRCMTQLNFHLALLVNLNHAQISNFAVSNTGLGARLSLDTDRSNQSREVSPCSKWSRWWPNTQTDTQWPTAWQRISQFSRFSWTTISYLSLHYGQWRGSVLFWIIRFKNHHQNHIIINIIIRMFVTFQSVDLSASG